MSGPSSEKDSLIGGRDDLVAFHAAGSRPREQWKIGTEHEKFGFRLDDLRPPTYEGPQGIEAMLRGLTRFGWKPVEEHGKVIALLRDGGSVTLEPAGQLELSGAMLDNIHDTCRETTSHLKEVKTVAEELGLGFLGMGFQPKWRREDMPWMPKGRYQ
ncbi:MAG: glutamate-cysteine ligase family protein, partial [Arenimonas sp.]